MPRIQGSEYSTGGPTINGRPQIRKNFGDYKVVNATFNYFLGEDREHHFQLRLVNVFNEKYAERYGVGNQRFGRPSTAASSPPRARSTITATPSKVSRGASTPPIR